MKCPIDQTEMEKGFIVPGSSYRWVSANKADYTNNPKMGSDALLIAWRCPKCRKVEFQAEEDK